MKQLTTEKNQSGKQKTSVVLNGKPSTNDILQLCHSLHHNIAKFNWTLYIEANTLKHKNHFAHYSPNIKF